MPLPVLDPKHSAGSPGPVALQSPGSSARNKLQSVVTEKPAVLPIAGSSSKWWQQRVVARRPAGRPARGDERNVLIVGAGRLGREMAAVLKHKALARRTVVGFLDGSALVTGDVLGRVEDLARIARAKFVDEVIVAIPDQSDIARRVIREAQRNRLNIRVVPDLYGYEAGPDGVMLEYVGGVPVLVLHEEKSATAGLFWKRALDLLLSAFALLVIAPLLLIIAVAIKSGSRGQVLYRAKRVGLKGKQFICYKFRTMVVNADQLKEGLRQGNERQGPCFKIADDPRITRLGRFLRRYSLDELPQLWNVLRGEMSLVGPRPHPLDDFEQYRLDHFRRLDVTPGITGLWQVTARRDPSFHRNMALDLEYIEHWSLWMDLQILWKTMFVIVGGSGS